MNIVASRVDERLVHGQIMTSWSKHLALSRIMVVDDGVARDDFMKTVLAMSAPTGITIDIRSVEDAKNDVLSSTAIDRTLLLFKGIPCALELARELENTPNALQELNIGNIGSIPGRTQITKNVWLSSIEKEQLSELVDIGVDVFFQMLYTDQKVEVTGHI